VVTTTRQRMTATQATQFDRYSVGNAAQVESALECGCKPYQDVFTYGRWQALGQQVQRGQKAIKLPTIISTNSEDDDGNITTKRKFHMSAVFCRHQVASQGKAKAPAPHATTPRPKPTITPAPTITSTPNSKVDQIMADWKVV